MVFEKLTYLLAQAISNHTGLREGWVLIESIREDVIRDIVTQIAHEQPKPRYA